MLDGGAARDSDRRAKNSATVSAQVVHRCGSGAPERLGAMAEQSTQMGSERTSGSSPAEEPEKPAQLKGSITASEAASKIPNDSATHSKDFWDKIDILGKLVGAIFVP